jgi:hypothetical protein
VFILTNTLADITKEKEMILCLAVGRMGKKNLKNVIVNTWVLVNRLVIIPANIARPKTKIKL